MHSSTLRGSDFALIVDGAPAEHASYFSDFKPTDRLGLVTVEQTGGLGAATLVMAHLTAFYDCYRESSDEFFAYPDFFSFQRQRPLNGYDWFDVWPAEKDVALPDDYWNSISTIASRGITILLVPDGPGKPVEPPSENRERAILESLRRTIVTCYAYRADPAGSDFVVTSTHESVKRWGSRILEDSKANSIQESAWADAFVGDAITQSYRRISLDETLGILAA